MFKSLKNSVILVINRCSIALGGKNKIFTDTVTGRDLKKNLNNTIYISSSDVYFESFINFLSLIDSRLLFGF
jgi:hypothetical protein